MKIKLLSAAIAAVTLAGFSQATLALTPNVTPDLEVVLSGASAQDKAVNALVGDLCDAGTLHTYKDDGGAPATSSKWGKAYTAWFCTMSPAKVSGLSATKNVLIYKRSAGGSAMGVSPLLDESANGEIDQLAINNNNCTVGSGTTYKCTTTNAGDLVKKRSDAGMSDVNPEMFTGALNTPAGFSFVDKTEVDSELTVRPAAALVFGVPVGLNLYKALQHAQGLIAAGCAEGDNSDACMPNLTKHQVASLISGQVKDWSEVSFNGTPLTETAGVTAPDDTLVHICKRTAGSGTGAQMYAKFLNNPCTEGTLSLGESNPFDGPVYHEMLESGDLEKCQNDLSLGTNTITDALTGEAVNPDSLTAWSIGVQSLEKNSDKLNAYRFVKIDGVAPTLANAFNGSYMDWVELTWQYRKVAPAVPTGDKFTIIDRIIKNASSPLKLDQLANKTHDFGRSGYLAVAANGYTFGDAVDEALPVMPYTHAAAGKLNNCAVPARVSGTGVLPLK